MHAEATSEIAASQATISEASDADVRFLKMQLTMRLREQVKKGPAVNFNNFKIL